MEKYAERLNWNIRGQSGSQLTLEMVLMVVQRKWNRGVEYNFYDCVGKSDPDDIPRDSLCFTIKPNPTSNQPGNGLVDFQSRRITSNDLRSAVQNIDFPYIYEDYKKYEINRMDFTDLNHMACVLLSFEIARRYDPDNDTYPIDGRMTESAIRRVMSSVNSTDENYAQKV